MYILTLNFSNQTSIICFHSGFLKTWFHWNKDTSIIDVIAPTSTFVNLNFNLFIKINYSNFIHCCLIFYRAGKENKLTCCGRASTKQYNSPCKHPAQKRHLICRSLSHSTSLIERWCPRCFVMVYLAAYAHLKRCKKNQQGFCPSLFVLTLSSSYKTNFIKKN